jgi:hypothetical protein
MKDGRRVLGIASCAAVLLWLMAGFGWWAGQAAPVSDLREPIAVVARVQPRPVSPAERQSEPDDPEPAPIVEPEPEPKPEPKPQTPPRAAREPEPEPVEPEPPVRDEPAPQVEPNQTAMDQPTRVRRNDVFAGTALLDGAGSFPVLSCSYDDFASFVDYSQAMTDLGARFVVVRNRQILGGIDVATGVISEASLSASYSPRARDYTGEPALLRHSLAIRGRFGRGAVVMMLVPRDLDAALFGGIARELSRRGERHQDYGEIRGRYQRAPGGGVYLKIDDGVRPDGSRVALGLLFDLDAVARVARPGRVRS